MDRLPPQLQRIYNLLEDGYEHPSTELQRCLWDELSTNSSINTSITSLRKRLRPIGQDILCRRNGSVGGGGGPSLFRLIRLIQSDRLPPPLVEDNSIK